jgi:hypothetical protein
MPVNNFNNLWIIKYFRLNNYISITGSDVVSMKTKAVKHGKLLSFY